MKCLRCGYCCCNMMVIIVDDPIKGVVDSNLITHYGMGEPCKHLIGSKPGEYSCEVHNEPWFAESPCGRHEQIGAKDADCRMGAHILSRGLSVTKMA